jgi:hypothetical protein
VSRNALDGASYGLLRELSSVDAVVRYGVGEIVRRRGEFVFWRGKESRRIGVVAGKLVVGRTQGKLRRAAGVEAKSAVHKNA